MLSWFRKTTQDQNSLIAIMMMTAMMKFNIRTKEAAKIQIIMRNMMTDMIKTL